MRLLLRRHQRISLSGRTVFMLDVRADFSDEEWRNIGRYRLGQEILYTRGEIVDPGSGLLGLTSRLAFAALNSSLSVDDLVEGKRIECIDIVEMMSIEERIKEAAGVLKSVLHVAAHFDGEEIVDL
jgi:hypothetical protein